MNKEFGQFVLQNFHLRPEIVIIYYIRSGYARFVYVRQDVEMRKGSRKNTKVVTSGEFVSLASPHLVG